MFILAAFQHHSRRLCTALAAALVEAARGSYETSDYLAGSPLSPRCDDCGGFSCWHETACTAEAARLALVEREAEEEVSEPAPYSVTTAELIRWRAQLFDPCATCRHYRREHGKPFSKACGEFIKAPAASVTAARPTEVSARTDPAAPSVGHPTSAGPPAAEDDPAGVPPSPAGSHNFVDWATPAVRDVLAHHVFRWPDHSSIGPAPHCSCGVRPFDQEDWRGHVAPLISGRLHLTYAAEQRRLADQRITRDLAAAGFKAGEDFEPPLWPFGTTHK